MFRRTVHQRVARPQRSERVRWKFSAAILDAQPRETKGTHGLVHAGMRESTQERVVWGSRK